MDAVIFDLDGVVLDTAKFHFLAWSRMAKMLGVKGFNEEVNEELKGVSRIQSLEFILKMGGKQIHSIEEMNALTVKKNEWYLEYLQVLSQKDILPGITELLNELEQREISTGLASASKNARTILHKLGIINRFQVITDGNDVRLSKPDPEVFNLCAKTLRAKPDKCVVIEDAAAGVEAAKKAGMKVIGIGDPKILNKADMVLASTTYLNFERVYSLVS